MRFGTPSKDLPDRKRVPLRTRVAPGGSDPGEIESFSADRIGEGFKVSISLGVLARKSVCFVSPQHSLSQPGETIPTPCVRGDLSSNSKLLPAANSRQPRTQETAELTDPMKSVYGQWVQAWSPKLKQPSDDLQKKSSQTVRTKTEQASSASSSCTENCPEPGSRWRHTRPAINVVLQQRSIPQQSLFMGSVPPLWTRGSRGGTKA